MDFVRDATAFCTTATAKLNSVFGESVVKEMKQGGLSDPFRFNGTHQVAVPPDSELQNAFDRYNEDLKHLRAT